MYILVHWTIMCSLNVISSLKFMSPLEMKDIQNVSKVSITTTICAYVSAIIIFCTKSWGNIAESLYYMTDCYSKVYVLNYVWHLLRAWLVIHLHNNLSYFVYNFWIKYEYLYYTRIKKGICLYIYMHQASLFIW